MNLFLFFTSIVLTQGVFADETMKSSKPSPSVFVYGSDDQDDQMSEIQWMSSSYEFSLLRHEQKLILVEKIIEQSEQSHFLEQKQIKELRQALNNKTVFNWPSNKWESLVENPIQKFCLSRNNLNTCQNLLEIRSQALLPWGR